MRQRTTLTVGLIAVVVASGVGWAAGNRIRSPAEIAARTAPPELSLITVPVERRTLTADVVTRGTVRFGLPQSVALPTSALKPSTGIVTTAPVKGGSLDEGSAALVVSGRPVFVLAGAQPAYRDIGPGAVGEDVRQLEAALQRLGFDPGPVDGIYDGAAAFAVAAWYQAAGWTPFGPTEEQLQALRTAQADRFGLQTDLLGARESLASAQAALTAATQKLDAAQLALQAAPAADAAALAAADQARKAAEAEVANRNGALAAALDAERVARLARDEGLAAQPPVTGAALETLEAALRAATGAVIVARADFAAAQAAAAAIVAPVPGALAAEATVAADAAAVEVAQNANAVRLAESRVALVSGRTSTVDETVLQLTERLGIQVPADEVLFFPTLPLQVDSVAVKTGDQVTTAPVMTVSNFQLAVDAALSVDDAKLVTVGAPTIIDQPDLAIVTDGTVTAVADTPGTRGVDPQRFYLEVTPTDAPAALVGTSVVLTITVNSTQGEVLAVPVAALSVAADGTSRVQVQEADGDTRYVTVRPGLAAKGLVAVTPDGDLGEGDLVVVGTNPTSTQEA
ncbi:MAG: peptidoglycan-binding protein [Acidimicrobiia bacterium]